MSYELAKNSSFAVRVVGSSSSCFVADIGVGGISSHKHFANRLGGLLQSSFRADAELRRFLFAIGTPIRCLLGDIMMEIVSLNGISPDRSSLPATVLGYGGEHGMEKTKRQ
jgi:hypothetical protein